MLYKLNSLAHIQWLAWNKGIYPAYPIRLWTLLKKEYDGILSHTERWVVEKYEVKKKDRQTSEAHFSVKTLSWVGIHEYTDMYLQHWISFCFRLQRCKSSNLMRWNVVM